MNVDNFVVRPQRRLVEQYREPAGWEGLTSSVPPTLAAGVADLPSAVRDDNEEAKRFDLIIPRLQLCCLRGAALSNDPWAEKRGALTEHSALRLNARLVHDHPEDFDEDAIDARGRGLADLLIAEWPGPDADWG
jgi:type I site-specific restriction endonuclease